MSIRINQNPIVLPTRPAEVRPDATPVPVQVPVVSTPTVVGVNGTSFKNLIDGLNLQGSTSTTSVDSVQRQLAQSATYARLMEDPVTARALNSLRVRDGSALAALGALLASGKLSLWPDKQAALDKLQQSQPDLFAQLVTLAQQFGLNAPLSVDAPSASATQAAGALSSAQGAYTQAKNTALGLDQQLGRELVSMNPALDGAQRQAYIESFHHAHQAEYDRASQAETDLATALSNPALDQAAGRDLNVAYAAASAAQTLAGGSHAADAMKWAARATGEGSAARDMFALTQNGVSIPGWTGAGPSELRAPVDFSDLQRMALGGAAGQLLSEANGDPQAALTNFSAMASALGMDSGRTSELLEGLQQAAAGDYSGLSRLATSTDPLAQSLGTVATVFAGLNAKSPDQLAAYTKFLKDTVGQGSAGARVVGDALHSLARASTSATKGSAAASQIASSAGALASALKSGDPSADPFGASSFDDGQALSDLLALAGGSAPPQADTDPVGDLLTDLGDLSAQPAESADAQAETAAAANTAADQQAETTAETSKHQQELQEEDAAAMTRQEEREQYETRQTTTRQTNRKVERKQVTVRQTHRKVEHKQVEHKQVETRQTQRVEHEAKQEVRGR